MSTALELNLIAVARQADRICEIDAEDTFEADMLESLDGRSARRVSSVLGEIASWLEDESHVLAWDTAARVYVVCPEPEGYVPPARPVVAGLYGDRS